MTTPVGYLYTPQQLAGSLRYGSGVRLGNWREDDEVDKKHMMDYIQKKESMSLTIHKKQSLLGPQLQPVPLSPAPADSQLRFGDVIMLKSMMNESVLSVSLGQKLISDDGELYGVFGGPSDASKARNAIKVVSYDGIPAGEPVVYGSNILLEFSSELGVSGYLASARAHGTPTATQLIAKQECYMRAVEAGTAPPYECVWNMLPQHVDDRIISQGSPVLTTAPVVFTHGFTHQRLASVNIALATDFGMECGICAHKYTETGKVNKLMRETIGRPSNGLISRTETDENLWMVMHKA